MSSFFVAFNAIVPITLIVILGYYIKEKKILDSHSISQLNKLCFVCFLPALTFSNIFHTNIREIIDAKLIIFVIISIFLTLGFGILVTPFFEKTKARQGSMIQGIYRSNYVILGVPIANNIAGSKAVAIASVLVMVVIPIYNVVAVILLSYYGGKEEKVNYKDLFIKVLKNPLIIASISGMVCSLIGLQLPLFLDKALLTLAGLGTSLPMFVLGASLNFLSFYNNIKDLFLTLIFKLIVAPSIFLTSSVIIGFGRDTIVALIALFCAPVAVSSAIMAEQMGCDGQLSTQMVIFSTVISCFTIFGWVFLLSYIGVI